MDLWWVWVLAAIGLAVLEVVLPAWVFLGFALICLGVFVMFYVEPRLKQQKKAAPSKA